MSRLVDAEDVEESIDIALERFTIPNGLQDRLHNQIGAVPTADVVEVVRCKDCKYLKPYTSQYGTGQFCECPCSFGGQGIKKPDDYCSYGERRDEKEYKDSILNARKGEE